MTVLGSSLSEARHYEDALSVKEARLSIKRRIGSQAKAFSARRASIANTYPCSDGLEEAHS